MPTSPGCCKICDQPAHGNHFGVMSCRACAAFFRRSAINNFDSLNAVCVVAYRNEHTCRIYENGKYKCKRCRLKKCYAQGMDIEKFQTDRDLISSTLNRSKAPFSLANFLGRPEFILCCEPDKATTMKSIIDVSFLIEKAKMVFQEDHLFTFPTPLLFNNSLERLTFTLEDMKKKSHKKFDQLKKVGKFEALFFWEQAFLEAANWFSGFPEFSELEMETKIEILKSAWLIWVRLAKLSETADFQRKKVLEEDFIVCGQNTTLNTEELEIDVSWCTNYSKDQIRFYVLSYFDKDWKDCVAELIDLNLTNVELNFMLIQLCLHDAGKKHQGKTLETTDRLIQIQADNLHDYYTKKLNLTHYSGRLTKLLNWNKSIELDVRMRRERNQLARVFDVFNVDFSHPEMFELT